MEQSLIKHLVLYGSLISVSGGRFPAGEREKRKDTVQSFLAASLATLSPGSRLSR
jgi:hypothetical protein